MTDGIQDPNHDHPAMRAGYVTLKRTDRRAATAEPQALEGGFRGIA